MVASKAVKDLITNDGQVFIRSYQASVEDAERLNQRIRDFEQAYLHTY